MWARKNCQCVALALLLAVCGCALAQSWQPQSSGATASLRGISAVDDRVAWASGTGGTFLQTTDGGATWHAAKVPGAQVGGLAQGKALASRTGTRTP